jgi:hypothetical protein
MLLFTKTFVSFTQSPHLSTEASMTILERDQRAETAGLSPLVVFAAKTLIVASVCTTSIIIAASFLTAYVGDAADRLGSLTKVGGAQFWNRLEADLGKAAAPDSGLSPEKQKQILEQLRLVSNKWKPFLSEAYTIITEPATAPPPTQR